MLALVRVRRDEASPMADHAPVRRRELGADEDLATTRRHCQSIPGAWISVDAYHSEVARVAVEAGADIINDISLVKWTPQ